MACPSTAPAQRTHQAVDHRGLSGACPGELAARTDGGGDRAPCRLFRSLGVRTLSRHSCPASGGGRLLPGAGGRPGAGARARSCERWLRLWRSLVINQGDSEQLKQRIVLARERVVARLEFMFTFELSGMENDDRRGLLIALEALTDVESWARMREFFGLSFEEACTVWVQTIDRLLPS